MTDTQALVRETPTPADPVHPSDVLMSFIVAFLAPMFLTCSGGDIYCARLAALETLCAYRARDQADLIAIAQIIACGLAALGSLALSMTDDVSLPLALRLRGNAVALNRAAEQNRRTLREPRPDTPAQTCADWDDDLTTPVLAGPAQTGDQVQAEGRAEALGQAVSGLPAAPKPGGEAQRPATGPSPQASGSAILDVAPAPAPTPAKPAVPAAASMPDLPTGAPAITTLSANDQQLQAMWAAAMTDMAAEFNVDHANLPPAERALSSLRAAALTTCANHLLLGPMPAPPRPADGIVRPNSV
jgi:hypothetical protein